MISSADLQSLRPSDLGLPSKFSDFREIQRQMAAYTLFGTSMNGEDTNDKRFTCMGVPPGGGKSLATHLIGALYKRKYVTLVGTLNLQQQQIRDGFDLVNISGRSNYGCIDEGAEDDWTCEQGDQHDCQFYGTPRCTYGYVSDTAKYYPRILTNYQYWMNARALNQRALEGSEDEGGEPVEMLICDEAHTISDNLSQFLRVWISNTYLRRFCDDEARDAVRDTKGAEWGKVGEKWLVALGAALGRVLSVMAEIADEYKNMKTAMRKSPEYRKYDRLSKELERIVRLGTDSNWIWRYAGAGIGFECIWPQRYAERYLWSGVPKILLLSATLRPKNLQQNGVPKDKRIFREWPRIFPPQYSPVYWVPTGKMGWSKDSAIVEEQYRKSVAALDTMIRLWDGRRGIVHTPSYDLAEWLYKHSRYSKRIVMNERGKGKAAEAEKKYRATPGSVFITPSFGIGADFPDEACEWQFIPKLPWPSKGDPVIQARMEDDKSYYNATTMQKFVQSCYRGTRHEEDRCTTVVSDNAIQNFRFYAAEFAPQYFKVMERAEIPGPPIY